MPATVPTTKDFISLCLCFIQNVNSSCDEFNVMEKAWGQYPIKQIKKYNVSRQGVPCSKVNTYISLLTEHCYLSSYAMRASKIIYRRPSAVTTKVIFANTSNCSN